MVIDIEDLENLDESEIQGQRLNAKEVSAPKKGVNILYFQSQMEQQTCLEELVESENPL